MPKSVCKQCNSEFNFYSSQSSGIFCSNKCQGKFSVKTRMKTNTKYSQTIRNLLLEERGFKCEECGIFDWNGKPLSFQIDHINGDVKDNRAENLKILCPNCHTQTSTWGAKNISEQGRERCKTYANRGLLV